MASQEAIFGDEEDAEKLIGESDFSRLKDSHFTAGLREGITAGKELTLQDGFDCGYKQTFLKFRDIGKLRGVLSKPVYNREYCRRVYFVVSRQSVKVALLTHVKSRNECRNKNQENIESLLLKLTKFELEEIKETKRCLNDVEPLLQPQHNVRKCELSELWNKCRDICYELDIDIEKILATVE